ncbi:MAG: PEP-CTERM sorting domain-containing protein [Verrucomicrobiota bacterium]
MDRIATESLLSPLRLAGVLLMATTALSLGDTTSATVSTGTTGTTVNATLEVDQSVVRPPATPTTTISDSSTSSTLVLSGSGGSRRSRGNDDDDDGDDRREGRERTRSGHAPVPEPATWLGLGSLLALCLFATVGRKRH